MNETEVDLLRLVYRLAWLLWSNGPSRETLHDDLGDMLRDIREKYDGRPWDDNANIRHTLEF